MIDAVNNNLRHQHWVNREKARVRLKSSPPATDKDPVAPIEGDQQMQESFLTATEVAQLFQLHVETIYMLIAKQGLPAAKIGHRWRFEEVKVRAWFEAHYVTHEPAEAAQDTDTRPIS